MKITLKTGKVIELTIDELNELCEGHINQQLTYPYPYWPVLQPSPQRVNPCDPPFVVTCAVEDKN